MAVLAGHPTIAFAPGPEVVGRPLQGRVEVVAKRHSVAPGVDLLATPGHTPGHQSVVVSSGSARAVILGDLLHCPLQIGMPEWGVVFASTPTSPGALGNVSLPSWRARARSPRAATSRRSCSAASCLARESGVGWSADPRRLSQDVGRDRDEREVKVHCNDPEGCNDRSR